MRNIKLELEYDGTDFCGWQQQPNVRTIQSEILKSIDQIIHENLGVRPYIRPTFLTSDSTSI